MTAKLDPEIEHCYVPRVWWNDLRERLRHELDVATTGRRFDPGKIARARAFTHALEFMDEIESEKKQ